MVNALSMSFLAILALVLQSAVPAAQALGHAKVPLLPVLVVYYALTRSPGIAVGFAVAAGVCHDAVSLMPTGYTPVLFCLLVMAAGPFRDLVYIESGVTAMFFGTVAGATVSAGHYAMLLRGGEIAVPLAWAGIKCGGTALLGLVAAPGVFLTGRGLDRLMGGREFGHGFQR